jgi:hypothetical protein
MKSRQSWVILLFLLLMGAVYGTSCGYHVAGKADLIPKNIKTIAVPEWGNVTRRYKLSENITAAVTREFISRTRYHIVTNPSEADAILTGAVINFFSYPTIYDPKTGRASGVEVIVVLQVKLTDKTTNKVLVDRPNFELRERYEVAIDPLAYFDESDVALQRLSRDVARSVVSAVLENF